MWGYTWGIQYALNSITNLRRFAECTGEWGSEWVFHQHSGEPNAGRLVAETEDVRRYARPFEGVPALGRLEYDLAEPLPPINVTPRRTEA